jgi:Holliday junction resolvasome RuvABC endonuclease subunit
MFFEPLEVLSEKKEEVLDLSITKVVVKSPIVSQEMIFGVDPGTAHLGLVQLWQDRVFMFQVEMKRKDTAPDRIQDIWMALTRCYSFLETKGHLVIEGASYADRYRQVELAEVRATAVIWGIQNRMFVEVPAPNSIRKKVFGKGTVRGRDIWTNIPPDCADALGCALFAL